MKSVCNQDQGLHKSGICHNPFLKEKNKEIDFQHVHFSCYIDSEPENDIPEFFEFAPLEKGVRSLSKLSRPILADTIEP